MAVRSTGSFGRTGQLQFEVAQPVLLRAQRRVVLADALVERGARRGIAQRLGRIGDAVERGCRDPRIAVGCGILRRRVADDSVGVRLGERLREVAAARRIRDALGNRGEVAARGVDSAPGRLG